MNKTKKIKHIFEYKGNTIFVLFVLRVLWEYVCHRRKVNNNIVLKSIDELNALDENDGFENWSQMKLWFNNADKQYFGKIIFWKNFELTEIIK